MERLTRLADGVYTVGEDSVRKCAEGYAGEAIDKLAEFENMIERLHKEQEETAAKLERLRREGREKSITFKQLLAKKLTNSNMLALLEPHRIGDNK